MVRGYGRGNEREQHGTQQDSERAFHYSVRVKMPELCQMIVKVPSVTLFVPPK
jgi:hypothetical protein